MKNIHILPTDKPSRLSIKDGVLYLHRLQWIKGAQHIYITSSDEEIKEGDWFITNNNEIFKCIKNKEEQCFYSLNASILTKFCKKIILTTDQDLIEDGVQAIDDEFLQWFVSKANDSGKPIDIVEVVNDIPYKPYPYEIIIPKEETKQKYKYIGECKGNNDNGCFMDSCGHNCGCFTRVLVEEPKQETFNSKRGLIEVQLKDPNNCEYYKEVGCVKENCDCYTLIHKQETLEEIAEILTNDFPSLEARFNMTNEELHSWFLEALQKGAKWQAERMYSDEDMEEYSEYCNLVGNPKSPKDWFNKFKKK